MPLYLSGSTSTVNPLCTINPESESLTRSVGLSKPGIEVVVAAGEGGGVAVGGMAVEVGVGAGVGIVVGDAGTAVADGAAGDASSELHAAAVKIVHTRITQ